jgi:hypothetical protein
MKTCQNCVHWESEVDLFTQSEDFGECGSEKFVYSARVQPGSGSDRLLYWDCEGYMASFRTGRDFGCIHFEEHLAGGAV